VRRFIADSLTRTRENVISAPETQPHITYERFLFSGLLAFGFAFTSPLPNRPTTASAHHLLRRAPG